jgi:hypothetical protein
MKWEFWENEGEGWVLGWFLVVFQENSQNKIRN